MLEHYFIKYEHLISPSKLSNKSFATTKKSKNQKSFDENSNSNFKDLFYEERRNNLSLKFENNKMKKTISDLSNQIINLNKDLIDSKATNEKNCEYIIQLEKIIRKIKDNKLNSNQLNLELSSSENDIMIKNNQLLNDLSNLKKFRQKILETSRQNDEINEKIFKIFKKIQNFFNQLNSMYYNDINNDKILTNYDIEFDLYKSTHQSIQEIFDQFSKFMKFKQDEYALLLNEKIEQIKKYENDIQLQNNIIYDLKSKNFDLNIKTEKLINEVNVLTEMKKFYMANELKNKTRDIKVIARTFSEGNVKSNVKEKFARAKNSITKSITKIERVFDPSNELKSDLINKMKKQ